MSTLFWPGDERAGDLLSDEALLRSMVEVEAAWLGALVGAGLAGPAAAAGLAGLVGPADLPGLAARAEAGGNPVIPLVALLRERLAGGPAATWVHRGLTSQDVLDTALMLGSRAVLERLRAELAEQVGTLADLAAEHRGTGLVGRTLGQHAVPITFGVKAAGWLHGLLDAADDLIRLLPTLPSQFGGAAGTRAATTELAALAGLADPAARALDVAARASAALGLADRPPWHTARAPVTRTGDVLAGCTGAYGRIANDVLILSRPEIGELAEPAAAGRGGSSALPQKVNPVLSVLVRRAALTAPAYAAQLHLAAADAADERPAGAWHTEWQALQLLGRHAVTAGAQTTELLAGLVVDAGRMRATLDAAGPGITAEQRSLAGPGAGASDRPYLGASDRLVDAAVARARAWLAAPVPPGPVGEGST